MAERIPTCGNTRFWAPKAKIIKRYLPADEVRLLSLAREKGWTENMLRNVLAYAGAEFRDGVWFIPRGENR